MEKLIKPAEPTILFSAEEPSWQEVNNFLKKARGKKKNFLRRDDSSLRKKPPQRSNLSLLNMEGKIFFGNLAMTIFMLDDYMDSSVKKGVPAVPGCLEHTSVISKITLRYFDKFNMRFTCGNFTTDWQKLEVGFVTGCTISVILLSARNYIGVQYWQTFEDLVELTDWARIEFKPAKSRSLVLRRGRVQDRFCFTVRSERTSSQWSKTVVPGGARVAVAVQGGGCARDRNPPRTYDRCQGCARS
ncbi:hypothetical protein N1851_011270 [Merluccius polli]|uniref:Uncharacterized protein n=1 Tax=Merluccius polli TaxID=89951 RepID=A0AA47MYJ4_MERPO|nr:hypothetical protein N1851_011270 [Merluccius polli]